MKKTNTFRFTVRIALLATLGAALSPAYAEEGDEIDLLTNPNGSRISFGLINIDQDNQRFGMYRGLSEAEAYAFGSLSLVRRDDATWTRITARNLGLSTQEFRAEYEKQGQWRVALDYSQIQRTSPLDIHTDLTGIGTNTLNVASPALVGTSVLTNKSTAAPIRLATDRYRTSLEMSRAFGDRIEFNVQYQHEKKEGTRLFGRGNSTNQEFLAEPIDTTTQQLDAVLNYTGDRLQLSGGYYGAFFDNSNPALTVTGGQLSGGGTPYNPIALPPDNSSHQLHLSGAYKFTDTTRANFKIAYTHAIQNDTFINTAPIANNSGRSDLGGEINTTLAQLGLNSRPTPKLDLSAKLRYEEREDQTAIARYITPAGATSSTDGFNEPRSLLVKSGKLDAAYRLPQGFTLSGGVETETKQRTVNGVRVVGYRETTEETSQRIELRRMLADSVSGSVSYVHSDRSGDDWRTLRSWNTTLVPPAFGANYVQGGLLQPIYQADRDRNKLRLALDWAPTDALSLQFNAEDSRDVYGPARRAANPVGVRSGHAWLAGVDASLAINDNWKLTAWGTRESTGIAQATCSSGTSDANCTQQFWNSALNNRVDSLGLGVRGKVHGNIELGGDLMLANDLSVYETTKGAGTTNATILANVGTIPSIETDLVSVSLFAVYPFSAKASMRIDYVLDQRKTNDWTWTDWLYRDGSWIEQNTNEVTHLLGMTYRYDF